MTMTNGPSPDGVEAQRNDETGMMKINSTADSII